MEPRLHLKIRARLPPNRKWLGDGDALLCDDSAHLRHPAFRAPKESGFGVADEFVLRTEGSVDS